MNVHSFLAKITRRNIYKIGIAYVVMGWLFVQVATLAFPFFKIPNWSIRSIVLLIALGFPIVLIIAWALELTPGGLQRTEFADDLPGKPFHRRIWTHSMIVAVALSVGL